MPINRPCIQKKGAKLWYSHPKKYIEVKAGKNLLLRGKYEDIDYRMRKACFKANTQFQHFKAKKQCIYVCVCMYKHIQYV